MNDLWKCSQCRNRTYSDTTFRVSVATANGQLGLQVFTSPNVELKLSNSMTRSGSRNRTYNDNRFKVCVATASGHSRLADYTPATVLHGNPFSLGLWTGSMPVLLFERQSQVSGSVLSDFS